MITIWHCAPPVSNGHKNQNTMYEENRETDFVNENKSAIAFSLAKKTKCIVPSTKAMTLCNPFSRLFCKVLVISKYDNKSGLQSMAATSSN